MELKRFVARDLRAASESVVAAYGREAMIISTAQINGLTELIVAVESAVGQTPGEHGAVATAQVSSRAATASAVLDPAGDPLVPQQAGSRTDEIVGTIKAELAQLRQDMKLAGHLRLEGSISACTPEVRLFAQALADEGVPPRLMSALAPSLIRAQTGAEALKALGEQLSTLLEPVFTEREEPDWAGIHVLYGPPGAGKTLMCARLACQASSRFGAEGVGWISYRDPRLGAWSQTQALAAQIGVEVFRARDADALGVLLDELDDRQAVFVDTAHSDRRRLTAELQELLARGLTVHLHAVVGADASIQTFRRLGPPADSGSLIVTRLDLAEQPWPLIDHLVAGGSRSVTAVSGAPTVALADKPAILTSRKLVESTLSPLLENRVSPGSTGETAGKAEMSHA
jgi:flagellar biosynthesis GTPase FlhF